MKIKELEAKLVSIPLNTPKYIATREINSREYLIIKITTEKDIVGWGYTFGSLNAKMVVDKELKPLVKEEDPMFVEKIWNKMFDNTLRWGRRGIYIRAISAIDIALWDIKAKASGQPLYKLLGGYRKKIPVYASGGYYSSGGKEDEINSVREEMKQKVEDGFKGVKMKIGGEDFELDIERIKAAREVLGEERKLYVDVNNGWKLYQLTQNDIKKLESIGINWIEEPFMPDALDECRRLREKINIPIANGEVLTTKWDFKQLLESDSTDIWQPDVTVVGGITEFKKVISLASIWNIPVAPHAMHEVHSQLAAAFPASLSYILEYFDTTGDIINYGKLLKNPLKAKKGFVYASEKPGVGIEFDEDLINKYSKD